MTLRPRPHAPQWPSHLITCPCGWRNLQAIRSRRFPTGLPTENVDDGWNLLNFAYSKLRAVSIKLASLPRMEGSAMAPRDGPEEFRKRAAECERLAETSTSQRARETLLFIAARWRALAEEDERRWRPREPVKQAA